MHALTRPGSSRFAGLQMRPWNEAGLEEASGAKFLRCVGENLRSHFRQSLSTLLIVGESSMSSLLVLRRELYHTLRSPTPHQMAQLIFDIAGQWQQCAISSQQDLVRWRSMESLPDCILLHYPSAPRSLTGAAAPGSSGSNCFSQSNSAVLPGVVFIL